MKKIVAMFFLIILLMGNKDFIFASYKNEKTSEEELKYHLQEIFDKRIEVWNAFMTGEYSSLKDIEDDFKNYTMEPLLTIDLKVFEDILNNPTSYEMIKDVNIINCQPIDKKENKGTYLVKIAWELEDFGDIVCEEFEYIVEVIKIKDNWLLRNYELNR